MASGEIKILRHIVDLVEDDEDETASAISAKSFNSTPSRAKPLPLRDEEDTSTQNMRAFDQIGFVHRFS
jgi:hypothetical protein